MTIFKATTHPKMPSPLRITNASLDLSELFASTTITTHSIWIKDLAKTLFGLFDDEHLATVAGLQVFHIDLLAERKS